MNVCLTIALVAVALLQPLGFESSSWELADVTVASHVQSDTMRYQKGYIDAAAGTWTAEPKATGTPPISAVPAAPEATSTAPLMPRIAGDW